jgi:hypothetical protein
MRHPPEETPAGALCIRLSLGRQIAASHIIQLIPRRKHAHPIKLSTIRDTDINSTPLMSGSRYYPTSLLPTAPLETEDSVCHLHVR